MLTFFIQLCTYGNTLFRKSSVRCFLDAQLVVNYVGSVKEMLTCKYVIQKGLPALPSEVYPLDFSLNPD